MAEFSKITFFTGTNFRKLCQKPRNPQKLIPAKINTNKVDSVEEKLPKDGEENLKLKHPVSNDDFDKLQFPIGVFKYDDPFGNSSGCMVLGNTPPVLL